MNIWITTIVFFSTYIFLNVLAFWIYGVSLKSVGTFNHLFKKISSIFIYLLFAIFIGSPFFISPEFIGGIQNEMKNNDFYLYFFLFCYVCALIPGGYYFYKKHLTELQRLGFFKK